MTAITDIRARQILDSRGTPTVEVDVILENGHKGRASVPSGASTGKREAVELRDNDSSVYCGKGVLNAINFINNEIFDCIVGLDAEQQSDIDLVLIEIDGTPNKSRIGANSILAVSLAVAKAAAASYNLPLYRYVGGISARTLPTPMINVLNGGVHADNNLDFQEFMIVPVLPGPFSQRLRVGAEVFYSLKSILKTKGYNVNVGDEGGFAPQVSSAEEACELLVRAIENANYIPGTEVGLALDCAATELFQAPNTYRYDGTGISRNTEEQVAYLSFLQQSYPIISIEDGMAEDDWNGWKLLTSHLGSKAHIVGDDLFVTNKSLLEQGVQENVANAILIKPNQIGTLTETLNTVAYAKQSSYTTIISHRSGETEDSIIADLAVATGSRFIKTGSVSRSDRTAKYNQLLRIEEELDS